MTEEIQPLIGQDLRIIQRPGQYRFGLEALLLAAMVRGKPEGKAADLGSGDGAIPLLLAYRKVREVTGYELQEDLVNMARRSAELNGLQDRVHFFQQDIRRIPQEVAADGFAVVTANPPFFRPGEGRISSNQSLALARHELACTLDDFTRAAAHLLRAGGDFFIAYRPERLVDLMLKCRETGLEPRILQPVQSRRGQEISMVLLGCRRGARPGLTCHSPLIIYEGEEYSPAMAAIYRGEDLL